MEVMHGVIGGLARYPLFSLLLLQLLLLLLLLDKSISSLASKQFIFNVCSFNCAVALTTTTTLSSSSSSSSSPNFELTTFSSSSPSVGITARQYKQHNVAKHFISERSSTSKAASHSAAYARSNANAQFPQYSNPYLTYHPCDKIIVSQRLNATHGHMNGSFVGPAFGTTATAPLISSTISSLSSSSSASSSLFAAPITSSITTTTIKRSTMATDTLAATPIKSYFFGSRAASKLSSSIPLKSNNLLSEKGDNYIASVPRGIGAIVDDDYSDANDAANEHNNANDGNDDNDASDAILGHVSRAIFSQQCVIMFVGAPDERVRLKFTTFALRAEEPDCDKEHLDIYAQVRSYKSDLLSTPFGGRYCSKQHLPPLYVSLHSVLALAFHSEHSFAARGEDLFGGSYQFVPNADYVPGTAMSPISMATSSATSNECSFLMHSHARREGEFMSPTYPGVYPTNFDCYYLFNGTSGQRVKLEFIDLDLHFGGPHCPLDRVTIYDGTSPQSPLIGVYCGHRLRPLIVFSTGRTVLVHFATHRRLETPTGRGFFARYQFSEKFVNLDFIRSGNDQEDYGAHSAQASHIRGTECDQRILSNYQYLPLKAKTDNMTPTLGVITSPNYPFMYHPSVRCRYFIHGQADAGRRLENVHLQFEMIHMPANDITKCHESQIEVQTHISSAPANEWTDSSAKNDSFDYKFCGDQVPPPLSSDGSTLIVTFDSGSTQGRGFLARYWFETDFRISGGRQSSPGECHYTFASSDARFGRLNSPHFPAPYPAGLRCVYELVADLPNEVIELRFDSLDYRINQSISQISHTEEYAAQYNCDLDWLEIHVIESSTNREMFYGRYCGSDTPGPIRTKPGIGKIRLVANSGGHEEVTAKTSAGFVAQYLFSHFTDSPKNCGRNISGDALSGQISSPNYPQNYPSGVALHCEWLITSSSQLVQSVADQSQIMLYFDKIWLRQEERQQIDVTNKSLASKHKGGCPSAVIRIWTDPVLNEQDHQRQPPIELCDTNRSRNFVSQANSIKISFITTEQAKGASGFVAIWTKVMLPSKDFSAKKRPENEKESENVARTAAAAIESDLLEITPPPAMMNANASTLSSSSSSSFSWSSERRGKCASLPSTSYSRQNVEDDFRIYTPGDATNEIDDSELAQNLNVHNNYANHRKVFAQKHLSTRGQTSANGGTFHCATNNFCLSPELLCDGVRNCGVGDDSDEIGCPSSATIFTETIIIRFFKISGGLAGIAIGAAFVCGSICLVVILAMSSVREKQRQRRRQQQQLAQAANREEHLEKATAEEVQTSTRNLVPPFACSPPLLEDCYRVANSNCNRKSLYRMRDYTEQPQDDNNDNNDKLQDVMLMQMVVPQNAQASRKDSPSSSSFSSCIMANAINGNKSDSANKMPNTVTNSTIIGQKRETRLLSFEYTGQNAARINQRHLSLDRESSASYQRNSAATHVRTFDDRIDPNAMVQAEKSLLTQDGVNLQMQANNYYHGCAPTHVAYLQMDTLTLPNKNKLIEQKALLYEECDNARYEPYHNRNLCLQANQNSFLPTPAQAMIEQKEEGNKEISAIDSNNSSVKDEKTQDDQDQALNSQITTNLMVTSLPTTTAPNYCETESERYFGDSSGNTTTPTINRPTRATSGLSNQSNAISDTAYHYFTFGNCAANSINPIVSIDAHTLPMQMRATHTTFGYSPLATGVIEANISPASSPHRNIFLTLPHSNSYHAPSLPSHQHANHSDYQQPQQAYHQVQEQQQQQTHQRQLYAPNHMFASSRRDDKQFSSLTLPHTNKCGALQAKQEQVTNFAPFTCTPQQSSCCIVESGTQSSSTICHNLTLNTRQAKASTKNVFSKSYDNNNANNTIYSSTCTTLLPTSIAIATNTTTNDCDNNEHTIESLLRQDKCHFIDHHTNKSINCTFEI